MPRKKAKGSRKKQARRKPAPIKSGPARQVRRPLPPKKRKPLFLFIVVVLGLVALLLYLSMQKQKDKDVLAQVTSVSMSVPEAVEAKQDTPVLSARGVYVLDVESGKVLFEKNSDSPILPASTTKIATAIAALKNYKLDQTLTVGRVWGNGSRMGLVQREQITVEALLHGLLIQSANDAAEVLAQNLPGGRAAFVEEMNKVAYENNLTQTHFTNPAGFDELLHFSTPKDLVSLALIAYEDPTISRIVSMQTAEVASLDGRIRHRLANTNQLLGSVDGVIGIKTGHTATSGESLVTLVRRDKHEVIIALMGSNDRFTETKQLIDWVFANFAWNTREVPIEELDEI